MPTRLSLTCLALLAAAGCLGESRTVALEERTLDAEGITRVYVDVGAGDLDIVGDPTLGTLRLEVRLRTNRPLTRDDDDARERLGISTTTSEASAAISVDLGEVPVGYSADVTLALPENLELVVTDGSGDMRILSVSGAQVTDSSGDIDIEDVRGDVRIDDDSGEIVVRNVGGDVFISDGSGDIDLRDIRGTARIDDSSGDIDAESVGDLEILADSSGQVNRR